ncbi:hypothetical protein D3C71_1746770 [compost metagenome]
MTAVASANGMYCNPVVKNRLVPNRHNALMVCSKGRLVRSTPNPDCGRKIPAINKV